MADHIQHPETMPLNEDHQRIYDRYFASNAYDERYPWPNLSTLQCLMRAGLAQAKQVLDLGCGNGRYAIEVLRHSQARLTACDISNVALAHLSKRVSGLPNGLARLNTVLGDAHSLDQSARFDFLLMLFGVLGHIGDRQERMATLAQLHRLASPAATMVLSVPSVWRRRPLEALGSWWRHRKGPHDWHDIHFDRTIDQMEMRFFYHLYDLDELRFELLHCGWEVIQTEAESVLPEWLITARPWLNRLDACFARFCPPALGYGIRVVCRAIHPPCAKS